MDTFRMEMDTRSVVPGDIRGRLGIDSGGEPSGAGFGYCVTQDRVSLFHPLFPWPDGAAARAGRALRDPRFDHIAADGVRIRAASSDGSIVVGFSGSAGFIAVLPDLGVRKRLKQEDGSNYIFNGGDYVAILGDCVYVWDQTGKSPVDIFDLTSGLRVGVDTSRATAASSLGWGALDSASIGYDLMCPTRIKFHTGEERLVFRVGPTTSRWFDEQGNAWDVDNPSAPYLFFGRRLVGAQSLELPPNGELLFVRAKGQQREIGRCILDPTGIVETEEAAVAPFFSASAQNPRADVALCPERARTTDGWIIAVRTRLNNSTVRPNGAVFISGIGQAEWARSNSKDRSTGWVGPVTSGPVLGEVMRSLGSSYAPWNRVLSSTAAVAGAVDPSDVTLRFTSPPGLQLVGVSDGIVVHSNGFSLL